MHELQRQHGGGQRQGDAVGGDDRPTAEQHAVNEPEGDAEGEQRVHRQRDTGEVPRSPRLERLGDEGDGGQQRGAVAGEIAEIEDRPLPARGAQLAISTGTVMLRRMWRVPAPRLKKGKPIWLWPPITNRSAP
jgi:hypothetical protein